jgi:hypothetical protein
MTLTYPGSALFQSFPSLSPVSLSLEYVALGVDVLLRLVNEPNLSEEGHTPWSRDCILFRGSTDLANSLLRNVDLTLHAIHILVHHPQQIVLHLKLFVDPFAQLALPLYDLP